MVVRWIVESILIGQQGSEHGAQLQELMPVLVRACQAGAAAVAWVPGWFRRSGSSRRPSRSLMRHPLRGHEQKASGNQQTPDLAQLLPLARGESFPHVVQVQRAGGSRGRWGFYGGAEVGSTLSRQRLEPNLGAACIKVP